MPDVALALVVFALGVSGIAGLTAWRVGRRREAAVRASVRAVRTARWEPHEASVLLPGAGRRLGTEVQVRRVTADGTTLDQIVVDTVPDDDEDWHERMLTARAHAAERAELLNTKP